MTHSDTTTHPVYTVLSAALTTLLVGVAAYGIFRTADGVTAVSLSFLCGTPFALGVMMALLAPPAYHASWKYAIFMPWLPSLGLAVVALLAGWELAICVIIGLPLFLVVGSLGGALVYLIRKRKTGRPPKALIGVAILLPYLLAPIETLLPQADEIRSVDSTVTIAADAETVWQHLIAVPAIRDEERRRGLLDLAGFPRPLAADLTHEGVDAMRYARYDNGLTLLEPITVWEPYRRYAFEVMVDAGAPAPFDQLGGTHLDVLEVGFELEPTTEGAVRLRLFTRYRLSTRLNIYARLWTDFLLRDLQRSILHVIKIRAEA